MKVSLIVLFLSCALQPALAFGATKDGFQLRRTLRSDGDAYDVGGKAPICWATTKPGTKNATVSRLTSCPGDSTISFVTQPPAHLFAGQKYHTVYRFAVDPTTVSHYQYAVKGTKWDVPHANIHSCVSTVGFCTPFIGNTPGLSTHTPAVTGNILATGAGNVYSVDFNAEVVLNPGVYTIIAHVRFFSANGTIQYDMATAVFRDVLPFVIIVTVMPAVKYAMYGVIGLGVLFLLAILCTLLYYRKHKVLRASQVNILMAMDLAGLVSVLALPLYAWPTSLSCNLRPWLCVIPLNLMFGLLFGKTWRIWKLMNNKGFKALRITEYQVFAVALACCFVELAMYTAEAIFAPMEMDLKNTVNSSTFIYQCRGSGRATVKAIHLTYSAAILAMGCIAANESSKLTTLFNEGKYIVFSIYTCAILAVIIVPASFAVGSDPTVGFILTVMGVVLCVCGTIGAINVPKILVIRSGVEISLTEQNKTSLSTKGSAATSMGTTSPTTRIAAAAAAAKSLPPGSQTIGQTIPLTLFKAMGKAKDAIAKVVTRQDQGFAVIAADFDACIADVDTLHALFIGYDKRTPAPVSPTASASPTPTAPPSTPTTPAPAPAENLVVSIDHNPILVATARGSEVAGTAPVGKGSAKVVPRG